MNHLSFFLGNTSRADTELAFPAWIRNQTRLVLCATAVPLCLFLSHKLMQTPRWDPRQRRALSERPESMGWDSGTTSAWSDSDVYNKILYLLMSTQNLGQASTKWQGKLSCRTMGGLEDSNR